MSKSMSVEVAIVGSGFSGLCMAIRFLKSNGCCSALESSPRWST